MRCKVIDTFPIGDNTSVTLQGKNLPTLNNITVHDENGGEYKLLSVAMFGGVKEPIPDETTVLISGKFNSNEVIFQ